MERVRHRELVDEALGAWFVTRTRDDALAVMRAAGATVGPVYDIADISTDRHFAEREIVVDVEDADLGSIPQHNIFPRLSATPGGFRHPAPDVGQQTEAILAEIGMTPADLEDKE